MPNVMIFLSIGLPLLMTAAAIATIHRMRERDRQVDNSSAWRDTSLDDWRKERDAQIEVERQQRAAQPQDELTAGRAEEGAEPIRQQRLGG